MLLPTKGVSSDRALITIGAEILDELHDPSSVSTLWERFSVRERSVRSRWRPRIRVQSARTGRALVHSNSVTTLGR